MSFSFHVKKSTKEEAKEAVRVEFARVLETQPDHKADEVMVMDTVDKYIDFVVDDPATDISVSVNGGLGWRSHDEGEGREHTSAGIGVNVYLVTKEAVA
jgi:hypothetical protein